MIKSGAFLSGSPNNEDPQVSIRPDLPACDGVLPNDEVHVWCADLALAENHVTSLTQLLDPDEQQRASRFKVPGARKTFVSSHAFVRLALARYLQNEPVDLRFRTTEHGKPELLDAGNIRFNLSHTEGMAAMAIVRERDVGVDVERIRENVEANELADRFFSAKEAEWLRAQADSERAAAFFACWTAKEAYIKACGPGLSMPLAGFSVMPRGSNDRLQLEIFNDAEASRSWSIWRLDLGPELRGAVAVRGENVIARLGHWRWPGTDFH